MNQSDAEAKRLEQEANALVQQSMPFHERCMALAKESSRLSAESIRLSQEAKASFFGRSKLLTEANRLHGEAVRLIDESKSVGKEAKKLRDEAMKLLEQSKKLKPCADVSEPSANYVTCRCQHCDTGIEFNAAELAEENSVVPCPHCGLETKLLITPPTPSSQKAEQKTEVPAPNEKELEDLMDGLTSNELTQALNMTDWAAKMDFLRSLQKGKANRMKIVSINNELELSGENIIIRRHGVAHAMAAGLTGERMIPISTLTAIQLKLGVWWSPGFILFSYAGSKPFMGGIIEATQDPDAFIFQKELNDEVSAFKAKVEKILRDSKQAAPAHNAPGTLTDELRKLAELKNQWILSQTEFEAAKKKLLA